MSQFWDDLMRLSPEDAAHPVTCILVAGHAGTGKDTIADRLVSAHRFTRFAFADPVKETAMVVFNVPECYRHRFFDRSFKEEAIPGMDLSPRKMVQLVGDGMRRTVRDTIWCENLHRRILSATPPNGRIVITDLRYANEPTYFDGRMHRTFIIKVVRDGWDGNVGIAGHPSETQLESIVPDVTISNDGTIGELDGKVDAIVESLGLP